MMEFSNSRESAIVVSLLPPEMKMKAPAVHPYVLHDTKRVSQDNCKDTYDMLPVASHVSGSILKVPLALVDKLVEGAALAHSKTLMAPSACRPIRDR